MKLIIGLGNPGKRYETTRHNIGTLLTDALRERWDFPAFAASQKFSALISEGIYAGERILIVQPQTYMNLSGTTVRSLFHFYKLTPTDILVLHDDIDLPFGTWRIATDSSAAGHNGVQSIIDEIGTQAFKRIRYGVGRPENPDIPASDYVLRPLSGQELSAIQETFPAVLTLVDQFLSKK